MTPLANGMGVRDRRAYAGAAPGLIEFIWVVAMNPSRSDRNLPHDEIWSSFIRLIWR
jgi:hypothetical protein